MYAREKVLMVVLVGLMLAVLPAATSAVESASLPPAEEVVRRALDRMKQADAEQYYARYTYSQRAVVEKLDDHGVVKEKSEELYRVYPVDGLPFQELVQRNGAPLSDKERKQQEERLKRRAKAMRISEAELIRRDLEQSPREHRSIPWNKQAWEKEWEFIQQRARIQDLKKTRGWTREELYEERFERYSR